MKRSSSRAPRVVNRCVVVSVLLLSFSTIGCRKSSPSNIKTVGGTKLVFRLDGKPVISAEDATQATQQRVAPLGGNVARVTSDQIEIDFAGKQPSDLNLPLLQRLIGAASTLELRILAENTDPQAAPLANPDDDTTDFKIDDVVVARWTPIWINASGRPRIQTTNKHVVRTRDGVSEAMLLVSPSDIGGNHLKSVNKSYDSSENPVLNFQLTDAGAKRMRELTGANKGRQLAIVVGGEIAAAPIVMSEISDRGQISGDFTEEEILFMISLLRVGSLPFEIAKEPPEVIPVAAAAP